MHYRSLMGTTVGDRLRQARERANWSIHDVSEKTKIRTDHIAALEEGNYNVFSAPVYIRGFVRNYAGTVKLDVNDTLALLDRELSQTDRFKEHPKLTPHSRGALDYLMLQLSKINWTLALPIIVVALILFAAIFSYRVYRERKTRDPLQNLGPGLYQPKTSGETLPLPPSTNR